MKIIIDPGHGGSDSGAIAFGVQEKDLNLVFSGLLAEKLEVLGLDIDKSLLKDEFLSSTQLTDLIKQSGAALCISCHNNALNGRVRGFEVIYSIHSDGLLANNILHEVMNTGFKVRSAYSRHSDSDYEDDYYYIIRLTYPQVETIIIEFGFMDNKEDFEMLTSDAWQNELTESVASAVKSYVLSREPTSEGNNTKPQHWAKADNDELMSAGILLSDHTSTLDKAATEGMVISLVNRLRKKYSDI